MNNPIIAPAAGARRARRLIAFGVAAALSASAALVGAQALPELDVATAAARIEQQQIPVIDVREPAEFATGVIRGAKLIPLGQLDKRLPELIPFKDQTVYVVCGSGVRSAQAIKTLSNAGFTQLVNIKGGMDAWRKQKLPITSP